jgi:hypothetical protein
LFVVIAVAEAASLLDTFASPESPDLCKPSLVDRLIKGCGGPTGYWTNFSSGDMVKTLLFCSCLSAFWYFRRPSDKEKSNKSKRLSAKSHTEEDASGMLGSHFGRVAITGPPTISHPYISLRRFSDKLAVTTWFPKVLTWIQVMRVSRIQDC